MWKSFVILLAVGRWSAFRFPPPSHNWPFWYKLKNLDCRYTTWQPQSTPLFCRDHGGEWSDKPVKPQWNQWPSAFLSVWKKYRFTFSRSWLCLCVWSWLCCGIVFCGVVKYPWLCCGLFLVMLWNGSWLCCGIIFVVLWNFVLLCSWLLWNFFVEFELLWNMTDYGVYCPVKILSVFLILFWALCGA